MILPRQKSLILIILTATPILLHWALLLFFSLNIPWSDDFFWYFDFMRRVDASTGLKEFIQTIATPYNDHWHIVQRSVIVAVTSMGLPINAIYLSLVGNLLFVFLFYQLFVEKGDGKREITVATAAAAWLFFQPISHYNFFECAFFNLPVLLFTVLTIKAFSAGRNVVFVWAILTTFSNGNGLLIWPILALMAGWRMDWKKAVSFAVIFVAVVAVYLTFSKGGVGPKKFDLKTITDIILYFVQHCGNVVAGATAAEPWLPMVVGILVLTTLVLIAPRALKTNESLFFFMLFILMSMGVIALTRKTVYGLSATIVNHYLLFPQLLFGCLIYYFLQQYVVTRLGKFSLLAVAISISCISYLLKLPDLRGHYASKTASLLNYEVQQKWLNYPSIQGVKEYRFGNSSTAYAISKGYYRPIFPQKNFLPEPCTFETTAEGGIKVSAGLQRRVLNRVLFVELTDKAGVKSFYTIDPYTNTVSDWLWRKRNRRADANVYLHLLHDPIDAQSIVGCRLFTVN